MEMEMEIRGYGTRDLDGLTWKVCGKFGQYTVAGLGHITHWREGEGRGVGGVGEWRRGIEYTSHVGPVCM